MRSQPEFPQNTPFKPAPALKASLAVNIFLVLAFILFFLLVIPLSFSGNESWNVLILSGLSIAVIIVFVLVWVHLYYESMWYELREDEMSWRRGIWFRTTGIVPYNRITNIDIRQGPVMRILGIHTIAIQTAGYSGQTAAEIRIEGVEDAENLRSVIRALVRRTGSAGDGTGGEKPVCERSYGGSGENRILEELIRIRTLLEEQKK